MRHAYVLQMLFDSSDGNEREVVGRALAQAGIAPRDGEGRFQIGLIQPRGTDRQVSHYPVALEFTAGCESHVRVEVGPSIHAVATLAMDLGYNPAEPGINHEVHQLNMNRILDLAESLYYEASPFLIALGPGGTVDAGGAYGSLLRVGLPLGGEFVLLGRAIVSRLEPEALDASKSCYRVLDDGGLLIQSGARS